MSPQTKKKSTPSTPSSPAPKPVPDRDSGPAPVTPTTGRPWWLIPTVAVGALLVLSSGFAFIAYASQSTGLVRGTTINGLSVGGLKSGAALSAVESAWAKYQATSLAFRAADKDIKLDIVYQATTDEEQLSELVSFHPVDAVNEAATFGHRGSFWTQLRERTSGFLGRRHEFGTMAVAVTAIEELLAEKTSALVISPIDAAITLVDGQPVVTGDKNGQTVDVRAAALRAARQASTFKTDVITIGTSLAKPTYVTSTTTTTVAQRGTSPVLERAPFTATAGDQKWTIDRKKMETLLGFRTDSAKAIRVGFDRTKTTAYLATIKEDIDRDAQEARFEVVDGKIKAFATSQVGRKLNIAASINALNKILDGSDATVALVVDEEKPVSEGVATNNLGIKEMVAEATTSFAGSPTNRRFNLSFGAKLLNGLMIKPGETFSLVGALGKIDGAHGWKSELVIKGPKITPEFGGGLCQVATTMFRVALNAGLPIVERTNHSLRISYYEPPIGLDATIYEPKPDLRFTNDYTYPLLIQTEVVGNNLTFRLYGTKDGRTVDLPTPKVYNRVGIPATTTVETTELKPGETVCQKPGHPGADATATYTVTAADGTKKTQVFQSHYRAIGVICRVGKKAPAKPKPTTNSNTNKPVTNTNTSTNTNTATNTNSGT